MSEEGMEGGREEGRRERAVAQRERAGGREAR